MGKLRIRQTDDCEQLLELDLEIFPYDERIDPTKGTWWLAEALIEGSWEPVGFCGCDLDDGAYLTRAGVLPMARGAGIQRKMIRVRVAWARAQGAHRVWTYTWWGNTRSQASLAREGFYPYKYEVQEDEKIGVRFIYFQRKLLTKPAEEVHASELEA